MCTIYGACLVNKQQADQPAPRTLPHVARLRSRGPQRHVFAHFILAKCTWGNSMLAKIARKEFLLSCGPLQAFDWEAVTSGKVGLCDLWPRHQKAGTGSSALRSHPGLHLFCSTQMDYSSPGRGPNFSCIIMMETFLLPPTTSRFQAPEQTDSAGQPSGCRGGLALPGLYVVVMKVCDSRFQSSALCLCLCRCLQRGASTNRYWGRISSEIRKSGQRGFAVFYFFSSQCILWAPPKEADWWSQQTGI